MHGAIVAGGLLSGESIGVKSRLHSESHFCAGRGQWV